MRAREVLKSTTVGKSAVARSLACDALDNPAQYSTRSLQSIYGAAICEDYDSVRIDEPLKSDLKNNQHHRTEILRRLDYALHCDPVAEKERLRDNPHAFFDDWVWMLDPRFIRKDQLHIQPFRLFDFQRDLLTFIYELWRDDASGMIKKSRDMGLSVIGCGFGLWLWLFNEYAIVGYGSYKEDYVTKKNSANALLPKIIMMLRWLPPWLQPAGWSELRHYQEKIITNPENGSQIIGETGDQLGRGGRTTWFLGDEFAWVRDQVASVAGLSAASSSTIYASTTAGPNTHFAQMERAGSMPIKIYRWVHDPRKLDVPAEAGTADPASEWARKKKIEIGPVLFAQEYDCDDAGSLEHVIIPPAWIQSARSIEIAGNGILWAGLDLGEDVDRSVFIVRSGGAVIEHTAWDHAPMQEVAHHVLNRCVALGVAFLAYDVDGIGAEFGGHVARHELAQAVGLVPVHNQGKPTARRHEDAPTIPANQRFQNRVTELWWSLRMRFWKTHQRVTEGADWPDEECISLNNNHPEIERIARQLSSVQWEHAAGGKIRRGEKRTGGRSPDDADALVYCEMPHPMVFEKSSKPRYATPIKSTKKGAW